MLVFNTVPSRPRTLWRINSMSPSSSKTRGAGSWLGHELHRATEVVGDVERRSAPHVPPQASRRGYGSDLTRATDTRPTMNPRIVRFRMVPNVETSARSTIDDPHLDAGSRLDV
jgi:hypothetical protein